MKGSWRVSRPLHSSDCSSLTVLSHAAAAYRVNPCTLWIIAHHRLVEQLFTRKFTSALTKPKQDVQVLLRSGSVGDTVSFFEGKLTGTCSYTNCPPLTLRCTPIDARGLTAVDRDGRRRTVVSRVVAAPWMRTAYLTLRLRRS